MVQNLAYLFIKQSKKKSMLEKSKLKKKSKYLKRPLQLKSTVSESLAHNMHPQSILKKETSSKPSSKPQLSTLEKDIKLQHLYHQVELQQKSESDSDNSEEMLLHDLEKQEEEDYENRKGKPDKKTMLFSHLMKNNGKLGRKLSILEEKVNQKIQKCTVEAKFKELTGQRASQHQQQNRSLLPKALQRSVARMSEEGITQVRLSNMQLTHLSLVRVKQQLSRSGRLRVLDLSYNGLTNKSMPLLADVLSQNVIQELSLKWNQLTYQGVVELIEVVTYNINLSSLDLSYNKLTNSSTAFIDEFLKLFSENKYLAHLNLQFCHLSQEQCAIFAKAYNLINESILCLHFKGNSHYYVNKLGYITKDKTYQDIPNISPAHQFRIGKTQTLNYCGKYLIGEDCCWLCQRWVGEMFKFPQQVLPSGLIFLDNIEYFIHLSCYDYQPIRLSIQECINSVQKRNDCKRLEWTNYEVHLAQIPIPGNKDIKYFFTLNGRSLINQNQPSIEVNEIINFEAFDVFEQIYAQRAQTEKYSVFVRRINTRSKDEYGYNKQKKMQVDIYHQNAKETFHLQNKKALRAILSKDKMSSVHLPMNFEPLPKISKTRPNTPIKSRVPSPFQSKQNNLKMIVNIRKCKEKLPTTAQSEKYLNLGITPRNKQFLFNYSYLTNNGLTHQDVVSRRHQFKQVETQYFGRFKETYIAKFLRRRQLAPRQDQLIDKFKILTRKYFNSTQLLFSDTFNFIYQTFVSINSPAVGNDGKQLDRKNKSVKFVSPAPNDTKLSINIRSEKILEGKTTTQVPIGGITQQKAVQRHALSMNCISDKYQLTKMKAMPGGSIHTLHSNAPSTDKTIKSIKDIPNDHATLIQLNLDNIPTPLDLSEDIMTYYTTLVTRYARERRVIFELINSFERSCDKEKLKELNEIIQTYNFYKLTLFYEQTVQHSIQSLFNINSFQSLSTYITNPLLICFSMKRSSIVNRCLQDGANQLSGLQAMQKQVQSQSIEDSFQSFSTYLNSNQHRIKVIKRAECMTMKSSKKRKGKYGRSLKNIKQQLIGEQTKVVLPSDSDKFLLQIEQEQIKRQYNELVHDLNVISDIFLQVLEQLITKYLTNHSFGEEKGIIQQWLRSHLISRIASFISDLLAQYRVPSQMARVKQRSAQICEHFSLNSIMQLTRTSLMLGSSVLQQNFKEYQFISPFHSYQFIIGVEITKLTHITRAIQETPLIVQQHLSEVLRFLSEAWKKYELESFHKEKGRKQAQVTRKMKRFKTINESIERGLIGQDENEQ